MTTEATPEIFALQPKFVERVWGRRDLTPWYEHQSSAPVGEAWLTGDDCVVTGGTHAGRTLAQMVAEFGGTLVAPEGTPGAGRFPLLVKMLFPAEKLSVQVHPDDAQAAVAGGETRAKTECWYVLEAEPGATVALGLRDGATAEDLAAAMGNASFEALLHQEPVAVGDMVYVEAGTVHAIGPGLTLLEVQQNSDTTYRLWDYGRPRELHLEQGMAVTKLRTAAGKVAAKDAPGGTQLIAVPHFAVERYEAAGKPLAFTAGAVAECLVGLGGEATVVCAGVSVRLLRGEAVVIPAASGDYSVAGEATFVRCTVPA